jgi:hypothetical protein
MTSSGQAEGLAAAPHIRLLSAHPYFGGATPTCERGVACMDSKRAPLREPFFFFFLLRPPATETRPRCGHILWSARRHSQGPG